MRIGIIGAGLAGLTCAQALVGAGHEVIVFERDEGLGVRRQGWRITVDRDGWAALKASLPDELYAVVDRTAGPRGGAFRITNERLRDAIVVTFDPVTSEERQVDRATLRAILTLGLEEQITWAATVVRLTEAGESVTIHFQDREPIEVDFAIVADGIGSQARSSVQPDAEPISTGLGGIYGQAPLLNSTGPLIPDALLDSAALAVLPRPDLAFFMTTMRYPPTAAATVQDIARVLPTPEDYVMWGLIPGRAHTSTLASSHADALTAYARHAMRSTHPILRDVVARTAVTDMLFSRFFAGRIHGARQIRRGAVLGDAIHPMPPLGAHGGNTALRDAALLAKYLGAAGSGSDSVLAADRFQSSMTGYGTSAVRSAERQLDRLAKRGIGTFMLRRVLPLTRKATVT